MAIIKPPLEEELKEILAKITFSRTDKITKITDGSVNSGIFFGIAKLGQKALKDVAVVQAHFFPDDAFGDQLDEVAEIHGIPPRQSQLGSATYIRLFAASGTTYVAGAHVISGSSGIQFDLVDTVVIGGEEFGYGRIESQTQGADTNVGAITLDSITAAPAGHQSLINEYKATGGRDIEDDTSFRQRIKDAYNIAVTGTIPKLEQIFLIFNPKVLRVYNHGTNGNGKIELGIATQNAQDLSVGELDELLENVKEFLSMSEINLDYLTTVGVTVRNIDWFPVDIGFRVQLAGGFSADDVRRRAQIRVNKIIDYRTWRLGQVVEWDDLLQAVKDTEGVLYVPDNFFTPNNDLPVDFGQLPRIRGFEMRDLDGVVISDDGGVLDPSFFPKSVEYAFNRNVLRTL